MNCRSALAALPFLAILAPAQAQAPVCVPPQEPWVPESEADLRAYADLVAADFERYFLALTRHFQCLEQAWQEGIEQGRRAAAARETFVARAKALGLGDRLGTDPIPAPGRP